MKALSIRSPWWWFILHGGKDIENRNWTTSYRGQVLLHASTWFAKQEIEDDWLFARRIAEASPTFVEPDPPLTLADLRARGGMIVGRVDIIGCTRASTSPWFFGRVGFQLANPVAFDKPIPCKGALGFFTVLPEVAAQVPA